MSHQYNRNKCPCPNQCILQIRLSNDANPYLTVVCASRAAAPIFRCCNKYRIRTAQRDKNKE
eukprot:5706988-Amphidinium_carterae.2